MYKPFTSKHTILERKHMNNHLDDDLLELIQSGPHHHKFESLAQYIQSIQKIVDRINSSLLISEKWYVDFEDLPENHVTVRLYDEYDKNLYQQEPNIDNIWCLELQ